MTEVPQPSHDPDLMLLQAMAQGNRQALTELYERHGHSILAYLIGQLHDQQQAEEVLQDVMLAAWSNAASFRGESKVRTWLIAIARMKALTVFRQRKNKPTSVELVDDLVGDVDSNSISEVMERHDQQAAVREAIRALPDDQRETLELVFFHELTGNEAAALLGVSPGTIKSRIHRAKNQLRGLLMRKEMGHGEE